jgi:hypothetical protein
MRINPKTLLFEELTPSDRDELLEWAERIVLTGGFPPDDPPWLTEWMRVAGYDDRQRLLLISTAVPQRVLLSLLRPPVTTSEGPLPDWDAGLREARRVVDESTLVVQPDRSTVNLARCLLAAFERSRLPQGTPP